MARNVRYGVPRPPWDQPGPSRLVSPAGVDTPTLVQVTSTRAAAWDVLASATSTVATVWNVAAAPGSRQAPEDIPNLSMRLRASDITGVADGAGVQTWTDAYGTTATQATSTSRPTYRASVVNGHPAVRFAGAQRMTLTGTALSMLNSAPGATVFVVSSVASLPTGSGSAAYALLLSSGTSSTATRVNMALQSADPRYWGMGQRRLDSQNAVNGLTNVPPLDTWQVITGLDDGNAGTVTAFTNGVAGTPATGNGTGLKSATNSQLGAIGSSGTTSQYFDGDIAEVLVYNRVLTTAERAAVHSYVQDTYAVTVADYVSGAGSTVSVTSTRSTTWAVAASATPSGYATPTLVKAFSTAAATNSATISLTVPAGGVAVGNLLVVGFNGNGNGQILSVTDPGGNTWNMDRDSTGTTGGQVASSTITTALAAGDTIAFTGSTSVPGRIAMAAEFSGITASTPLDQVDSNTGTGTNVTPASLPATTQTDELLVGWIGVSNASASVITGLDATYTEIDRVSGTSTRCLLMAYRTVTATGSYNITGTLSSSLAWRGTVATYKAAAATAGTVQVTSTRSTTWAATASVTSTRATTWTTTAPVTSVRPTTWAVRAVATSTRATSWAVLNQATASRATSWATTASVSATRPTTWAVRQSASSARATAWNVQAVVSSLRPTSWAVAAWATSARATSWATLSSVLSQRPTVWNTLASVAVSRPTSWAVRTQTTSARATSWTTLTAVTSTRSTTWDDAFTAPTVQVTSSRGTSWAVLASATSVRSAAWVVAVQVSSARATTWATLARVSAARPTTWAVRQQVTAQRATVWATLTSVAATRATSWAVPGAATSARVATWAVATQVSSVRPTTWADLARVTSTRTASWNALAQVTAARPTAWQTLAQVLTSRSASWGVLAVVSAARPTSWAVYASTTATRPTTWTTLARVTSTRATTWNVDRIGQVTSARAASWAVAAQVTSTRATTWAVVGTTAPITSSRTTSWAILGQATSVRAASWATLSRMTSTRPTSWAVAVRVSSARGAAWAVLAAASSARATSWAVLARVDSARPSTWDVLAVVTSERVAEWAIQPPGIEVVTSTRSVSWITLAQVTVRREIRWSVNGEVTRSTFRPSSGGITRPGLTTVRPRSGTLRPDGVDLDRVVATTYRI